MLKELTISNYALIDYLRVDLSQGFTSITGETGAGKSILLGGLSLALGKRADTNEIVIRVDSRYFRPSEVDQLLGDPKKALKKLGWEPKITLEEMINEMIIFDKKEALIQVNQKKLLNK